MATRLRDLLYEHDELADLDPVERRLALRELAVETGDREALAAVSRIADEIDGFGALTSLMLDDAVTDILVNGPDEVWVDRAGSLERTSITFDDEATLSSLIRRLVGRAGARIDRSHPIADARLADGSRIHVVLPPIAPRGPLLSIRRFPQEPFALDDLVTRRMLTTTEARSLRDHVRGGRSIIISGRTGTGKSTLLDALLRWVPEGERVVTIEELPELRSGSEHRVALIARPPNVQGEGAIGLEALVRAALRMRPDRIVVGEVRGPEALAALEAMTTGHEGSLLTVHARSAANVLERLVTLSLKADAAPAEEALRRLWEDAIDVIVHLDREGRERRVVELWSRA